MDLREYWMRHKPMPPFEVKFKCCENKWVKIRKVILLGQCEKAVFMDENDESDCGHLHLASFKKDNYLEVIA